jgi:hypothetical protein
MDCGRAGVVAASMLVMSAPFMEENRMIRKLTAVSRCSGLREQTVARAVSYAAKNAL